MHPDSPLRILHTESSFNWGGQEYRTLEEVRWLRSRAHPAWIACHPQSEMYRRAGDGLCVPVRMKRSVDPLVSRTLRRFCVENKIDVVHTHSSTDAWVCYPLHLGRWPVVRSRQITNPVRPTLDRSFIYRHGCSRVIASAECIREKLVAHTRVAAERVDVIGEGTDMARFNPGNDGRAVRRALGVADDTVLFGLVAMFRPEKGHQFFIEAATRLVATHGERVRFVMVGEGVGDRAFEYECRRLIEARFGSATDGPVMMTGYRQDVPQMMAALDVLVVPSLADAQSLVIPQAFATGRPVIASQVGGLPELVSHGQTGLLVRPGDVWELTTAMARMADDECLRRDVAFRALAFARATLSFDRRMEQCLALYARLVGERRAIPEARKAVRARRVRQLRTIGGGVRRQMAYAVLVLIVGLFVGRTAMTGPAGHGSDNEAVPAKISGAVPVHSSGASAERGAPISGDSDVLTLSLEELAPMKYAAADERIIG